ncbi:MAG TPA: hypothetical protein VK922_02075 [Gemmatimonadaceae bacterium]|nr:hypothetical protein [Gemmatimonadaceae bacterium]
MRIPRLTLLALAGLLVSTVELSALAQDMPTDAGDGQEVCASGSGQECKVQEIESCTRWTIVELKIGTSTVISRECAEKTTTKKYYYWTKV